MIKAIHRCWETQTVSSTWISLSVYNSASFYSYLYADDVTKPFKNALWHHCNTILTTYIHITWCARLFMHVLLHTIATCTSMWAYMYNNYIMYELPCHGKARACMHACIDGLCVNHNHITIMGCHLVAVLKPELKLRLSRTWTQG